MKTFAALLSAFLLFLVSGCGSDQKEDAVRHLIDLLDQTSAKMAALAEAIDTAVSKADPQKGIVLGPAIQACDALKTHCKKELQPTALQLQLLKTKVTPEEKVKLHDEFEQTIQTKISNVVEKSMAVSKAIKKLKELSEQGDFNGSRDQVKTFITKTFAEAEAEYNSLNRQAR